MKTSLLLFSILLMCSGLSAYQNVTTTADSRPFQDIHLGLEAGSGFDLGYEREIFDKQGLKIQISFYPLGNDNYVNQYIFGTGVEWNYYFTAKRELKGWFTGVSNRLVDVHTDYPSNEYVNLLGFLGGYQFVFGRHFILSAAYGLQLVSHLNSTPSISDKIFDGSYGTNLEINMGWAF